jgi:hypothetical protein
MRLLLLVFLLAVLPPVNADVDFELSAPSPGSSVTPGANYQQQIDVRLGSNETGDTDLLVNLMWDIGLGWSYQGYTGTLGGEAMTFDVTESDEDISGIHRVSFQKSGLEPPALASPEKLTITVDLTAPEVESSYTLDAAATWYFNDTGTTELREASSAVEVKTPVQPGSGSNGGGPSSSKPKAVLLANSIDYELAGDFNALLKNSGIEVIYTDAANFHEHDKNKFIVILGGPDAYEGVGEIVQEVLSENEQSQIREGGNRKMYVKTKVWTTGQVVMVIAGTDRVETQKTGQENKVGVKNKVKGG